MGEPFRKGMRHPPLKVLAFTEAGVVNFPVEYPGGVTFRMVSGATVVTGAASGDAFGVLTYQWGATDLDIVGTYAAYFIATDGAGKTESFPRGYNLEIVVVPTI